LLEMKEGGVVGEEKCPELCSPQSNKLNNWLNEFQFRISLSIIKAINSYNRIEMIRAWIILLHKRCDVSYYRKEWEEEPVDRRLCGRGLCCWKGLRLMRGNRFLCWCLRYCDVLSWFSKGIFSMSLWLNREREKETINQTI
jgi:hypothetical protein